MSIKGFYIIKDGVSLYSQEFEEKKYDENLTAGFLSAINSFANQIQEGDNIQQIVLGEKIFSFTLKKDLIFVLKHEKFAQEAVSLFTDKLSEIFLERFEKKLEGWHGDMSIFKRFDEDIKELMSCDLSGECREEMVDYVCSDFESCIVEKLKKEGHISENYDKICKICQMEIMEDSEVRIECPNHHPVHESCLSEWIPYSKDCPTCRMHYPREVIEQFDSE